MSVPTVPVTRAGHAPDVWRDRVAATARLSVADLRALAPGRDRLVVLSAHPDDETIGAGRLLSAWRRTGGHAQSVLSTSGEACFDHVGTRPDGLAAERLVEWRNALAALDVEAGDTYGLPDGGLEAAEDALEAAVTRTLAERADLRTELGAQPAALSDRTVLLAPHPGDPHPDHRTVGRATGRVAARLGLPVWFFPFWMTYWSDPTTDVGGQLVTVTVDPADDDARAAAVRCFPTQVAPVRPGWGAVIPPELLTLHDRQLLVLPGPGRP